MENKSPFSLYDFLGYFIPGALFFYLLGILLPGIEMIWFTNNFLENPPSSFNQTLAFIIISYVLGHAINYISSITIEQYSIWSIGYPSRYILGETRNCYFKKWSETNTEASKGKRRAELVISFLWRAALLIIIFPMYLFDLLISKIFCFRRHYTNTVDRTLKTIISDRVKIFKERHPDPSPSDGDFFRLIYYYCYEKFDAYRVKFNNYVALYGFTRAISFVFCVFGWILLIKIIVDRIKPGEHENWHIYAFIASSLLSYFFYLAFVKFYRRYTLEGFMCLTIDPDLQQASEEAKKQASEQQDIEPQDNKAKQLTSLMSN